MARQILSNLFDCSRCGLKNAPGATHCASCGNALGAGPGPSHPPASTHQPAAVQRPVPTAVVKPSAPAVPRRSPAEWFGWKRLEGTIIHASPQHIGRLQKEWWEIAIKLLFFGTLIVVFGVTALVILITVAVLSLIFSSRSRRSSRPGIIENIATQIASFFILGRIFGPKATIPVADYRVRDGAGVESLIRIEGYLLQGSLAVGDDVTAEGFDHGGTLIFRRGWNRRLNCSIRVKRR
jgi:hypothetical protein